GAAVGHPPLGLLQRDERPAGVVGPQRLLAPAEQGRDRLGVPGLAVPLRVALCLVAPLVPRLPAPPLRPAPPRLPVLPPRRRAPRGAVAPPPPLPLLGPPRPGPRGPPLGPPGPLLGRGPQPGHRLRHLAGVPRPVLRLGRQAPLRQRDQFGVRPAGVEAGER